MNSPSISTVNWNVQKHMLWNFRIFQPAYLSSDFTKTNYQLPAFAAHPIESVESNTTCDIAVRCCADSASSARRGTLPLGRGRGRSSWGFIACVRGDAFSALDARAMGLTNADAHTNFWSEQAFFFSVLPQQCMCLLGVVW